MSHPDDAALVAYWAADGDPAPVEDHAFACDGCARRLAAIGAIVRAIPAAVRRGLRAPAIAGLVAHFERDGLRARHYTLAPGERVACTVGADDDLLVSWLTAELAGAPRVDVVWSAHGQTLARYEDVPIDRAHGLAVLTVPGDEARTWPDVTFVVTLLAVDAAGERPLGAYTFEHTGYRA